MTIRVEAVDTVTLNITFPTPVEEIAAALRVAEGEDPGLKLRGAVLIDDGHQRDPVTKGVRLTFTRVP